MEIELAIYEDCVNLIDKFVESENHSFKTFSQKWHQAMFQHVYAVQTTTIEIIQTTKTILHLAKRIACAKDEFTTSNSKDSSIPQMLRRVGGIYLMYAIYFKQPTNKYVKVLMSNETWQGFIKFIEELPVSNITEEVRFIFWKLYKEDAFRFTAFDYELGLENLIDYDRLYDIHNGNKYVDVIRVKLKQKLTSFSEIEKDLPSIVSLEEQYNASKQTLYSMDKSTNPLPSTKIFRDIQDTITSLHNIFEDDYHSQDSSCLKINQTRNELKRKAAGFKSNDEDSTAEEETKKRFGRPTVRQIMKQPLPDIIMEDLKNNSTEDEN